MTYSILSFGQIGTIEPRISEVVVNSGIEMNMDMVIEYHDYLTSHMDETVGLLINKKNDYTYDFEAQKHLVDLPHIKAMAVVVYRQATRIATESLVQLKRTHPWNLCIFDDYDEALGWLRAELAK